MRELPELGLVGEEADERDPQAALVLEPLGIGQVDRALRGDEVEPAAGVGDGDLDDAGPHPVAQMDRRVVVGAQLGLDRVGAGLRHRQPEVGSALVVEGRVTHGQRTDHESGDRDDLGTGREVELDERVVGRPVHRSLPRRRPMGGSGRDHIGTAASSVSWIRKT